MDIVMRIRTAAVASAAILALVICAKGAVAAGEALRPEAAMSPMERVAAARDKANADNPGGADRVFGGKEADKGAYPFQVALLTTSRLDRSPASQPNAQFCGGSLIAPQWVLTAAHCLFQEGAPIRADTVTVLSGATDLAEGTRHRVAEVIVNPGYSEATLDNDLGLLRLADPAAEPTIAISRQPVPDSGATTVTGWGMMQDGTFPNVLMVADLELENNAACNAGIKGIYASDLKKALGTMAGRMRYSEKGIDAAARDIAADMRDPLTDNMICAGTTSGARDACNGDSGGPLFIKGPSGLEQVGIVSWGEGPTDGTAACGHKDAYGVYTRVSNYAGWIDETMNTGGDASKAGEGSARKP